MKVDKDVYIPMRDGVNISMDIYSPDGESPRPVILIRTPYIKTAPDVAGADVSPVGAVSPKIAFTAEGRISPNSVRQAPSLVGAVPPLMPFIEAGYVVVVSDSRGTGYAEGDYDYYNIASGPYDGYDTVEWIAEQPWCDGNVGMWGLSGSGVLALAAAVTAPPHLKAVATAAHPVDFYHDQWYPGGVLRFQDRVRWPLLMEDCIGPLDPGDPEGPEYERKRAIYEKRYRRYYDRMAAGLNPIDLDWATEGVQHPEYDEFWTSKSFTKKLADITVPVLTMGVLHDHFIGGTILFYDGVTSQKRLIVVPGSADVDGGAADGGFAELQMDWFDRFLKGTENGVDEEPPVRVWLNGAARAEEFASWPPASTPLSLHLVPGEGEGDLALSFTPSEQSGSAGLAYDPADLNRSPADTADQRSFDEKALVFTTPPLEHDVAVVGIPELRLAVVPDAVDSDLCVRMSDVQPDGSSRLANTGALRVRGGSGEAVLAVDMLPLGNMFKAGHRIRIAISASDFPFVAPNANASRAQLKFGGAEGSVLTLPVVEV